MAKRRSYEVEGSPKEGLRKEYTSQNTQPPPPALGVVFFLVGLVPILIGTGSITVPSASVHCPLLILTGIGVAFSGAGLLCFFQGIGWNPNSRLLAVLGLITMSGFFTPFAWLAFFSNELPLLVRVLLGIFIVMIGGLILISSIIAIIKGPSANIAANGMKISVNNESN